MSWRIPAGVALAVVLIFGGIVVLSRASAAPAPDTQLMTGRDLFVTHCAVCHGPGGQGDGPSATGLATKPANLADGRLMNRLPDDFLERIVTSGGPAVGLAPTMPPFARLLSDTQRRDVIAYVRTLAQPAFRPDEALPLVSVEHAPKQPIFFNHVIHADSFNINCQYCHADARRGVYAGLPSVERCMGCHKIIGAQDNPEIRKIHEYAGRGEPIPWVRVFKVPEFVYFSHKPHIRAGVECQACHGQIQRMMVVGGETGPSITNDVQHLLGFRPTKRPLTMGWCVDCHKQYNETKKTQAPLDCIVCHH